MNTLAPLDPTFVSVTYGAGGSTRDRTHATVAKIAKETPLTPAGHLTCVGATRDELRRKIGELGERGIYNILAIRGDPPRGKTDFVPAEGGLKYASELVALIRDEGGRRLAKRDDARAIATLRMQGKTPQDIRALVGL